jgi:hypothetical protein
MLGSSWKFKTKTRHNAVLLKCVQKVVLILVSLDKKAIFLSTQFGTVVLKSHYDTVYIPEKSNRKSTIH